MNITKSSRSSARNSRQLRASKSSGGLRLSAADCRRLTRGFGLPIEQIMQDILTDADNAAQARR